MRNPFRSLLGTSASAAADAPTDAIRHDPALLQAWMSDWIARKAGLDPAEMHPDKQFTDYGLDSLMAVTLSGELETLLGRTLSPSIAWEYPSIGELSAYLAAGGSGTEFDMDAEDAALGAETR